MNWYDYNKKSKHDLHTLTVKQVYCWIFDKEGRIVVVSKDGDKWQLPGGKPEHAESFESALNEAGLKLQLFRTN